MQSLKTVSIDLHGMQRFDAECALKDFLNNLSPNVNNVEVIHGIGTGVLKQMVAEFYHYRIEHRAQCIGNAGKTIYYIKKASSK